MESVEGVWGNFTFKLIEPSDYARVLEFLRVEFLPNEPICTLVPDREGEDSFADFKQLYEWIFNKDEGLSFIALETATGAVAAVRVTFTHTKETSFSHFDFKSRRMMAILKVVQICDGAADPFGKLGVDHFGNFITASTGQRFLRQGLVTEMYRRSLELLRQRNVPFARSIFSSPWTRKASANLGFKEYSRVYFKDVKGEDGTPLIPNAKDEDFATFAGIFITNE